MVIRLDLPLPPSPNTAPRHPMERVRWKNDTKRRTWFAACGCHAPTSKPPQAVTVDAHFRVHNLRDEDNLYGSLKATLDSLRLPRKGESCSWREGLADRKGFFVDDAPAHLTLRSVTQELDRSAKGLTLVIEPLPVRTHEGGAE